MIQFSVAIIVLIITLQTIEMFTWVLFFQWFHQSIRQCSLVLGQSWPSNLRNASVPVKYAEWTQVKSADAKPQENKTNAFLTNRE